jgi:hypothetical protein
MKNLLAAFLVLSVSLMYAKTYNVTLYHPSVVGGTELQPGSYKLELEDQKIVIRGGKTSAEAAVRVENDQQKFKSTTIRYQNGDGKYRIQEIRLGGTNTRLVLN